MIDVRFVTLRRVTIGAVLAATSLTVVGAPSPSGAADAACFTVDVSFDDRMDVDAIDEASGLLLSRQMAGVMWTHNDHDPAAGNNHNNRIYAVNMNGALLATVQFNLTSQLDIVPGATFFELEDISYGHGPDRDPNYIYLSDTGDNGLNRAFSSVYRFPEPVFTPNPQSPITINVSESELDATRIVYESFRDHGQTRARNVEAMFVDPGSGDLFLFEKALHALDENGQVIEDPPGPEEYSFVHRVRADRLFPANTETVRLATIKSYVRGKFVSDTSGILAADISADGTIIALKNTDETFYWVKKPGDSVLATFGRHHDAPCRAPNGVTGEGLAISPTSDRFVAIREGLISPIWDVALTDQQHLCFGRPATILGTGGDDIIHGTSAGDVIVTFGGDDSVFGLAGADRICVGPGDDYVRGGKQRDRIDGGWGYDTISGSSGKDIMWGGDGRDTIFGNVDSDRIYGGKGGDVVDGGGGNDTLRGGSGTDSCDGGTGTDSAGGCEDVTGVP